jgi:hypothetical protein
MRQSSYSTSNTISVKGYQIALPLAPIQGFTVIKKRRLDAVKREIGTLLSRGYYTTCPITGRAIRIWRHNLSRGQVTTLKRLDSVSKELGKVYVHLKFLTARRDGNLAKMALWDLISPLSPDAILEGEKCGGMWRITERGRDWLAGRIKIPRQVAVLFGKRVGYVDPLDLITVDDVSNDFDKVALLDGGATVHTTTTV